MKRTINNQIKRQMIGIHAKHATEIASSPVPQELPRRAAPLATSSTAPPQPRRMHACMQQMQIILLT